MVTPTDGRLFTVKEVSALLHINPATLYKLLMSGEIPSLKIRGARRIIAHDLAEYIIKQVELEQARLNGGH